MATVQRECIVEVEYIGPELKLNDIVDGAIKRVWHDAADVFRSVTVDFGAGPVVIEGDGGLAFRERDAKSIELRLSAERLSPQEAINNGEVYLSLVFLAMNLAVPGSANFSSVRIRTSEETGLPIRWSSAPFEGIWLDGDQWPWAQPSEVSLAETGKWLQHLRPMGSQVAHSCSARVVLSTTRNSGISHLTDYTHLAVFCA